MKVISAHQPAYLPWLGYFHKIMLSDEFVLMDDVQFEKNSYINRNRILSSAGPTWLTIPVNTRGYREKTIREIIVSNDRWRAKHLKSVEQTYGKSNFFHEIMPILTHTLRTKSKFLVDYTNPILFDILTYLQINTPITFASTMSIKEKKLDYVIALAKRLTGSHFVFGKLGRDYADSSVLAQANLVAFFQDYRHPVYSQGREPFTPYLSIIDALFAKGRSVSDLILENNTKKKDVLSGKEGNASA